MKSKLALFIFAFFILPLAMACVFVLTGCAGQPQPGVPATQPVITAQSVQTVTAAEKLYATSVQTANQLRADGVFTEAEWQTLILPGVNGLSSALDKWDANPASTSAMDAFNAALPNLLQYIELGNSRKPPPTTKPSK